MATFSKLGGTTESTFTVDNNAASVVKLVNNAGTLEFRDSANALTNISATNVQSTDPTVQYVNVNADFNDIGGTVDSTYTLPSNTLVESVRVVISTAFNNDAPTLQVGTPVAANLFAGTGDFELGAAQDTQFRIDALTRQNDASAQALRVTLGSGGATAPTQGQIQVLVGFIVAPHQ